MTTTCLGLAYKLQVYTIIYIKYISNILLSFETFFYQGTFKRAENSKISKNIKIHPSLPPANKKVEIQSRAKISLKIIKFQRSERAKGYNRQKAKAKQKKNDCKSKNKKKWEQNTNKNTDRKSNEQKVKKKKPKAKSKKLPTEKKIFISEQK